jgi:small conductance mechanosensitive channel
MYLDFLNMGMDLEYSWKLISITILIIITLIIIKISMIVINKVTKKFDLELTLSYLLKDLIKYIIYIVAIAIGLKIFSVNVNSIILSLGIVSLSIGFAGRDIISNFISGMFILLDKTIKVGEVIETDNVHGKIKKVGFRTTTLLTPNNSLITIPNSVFSSNPYINHTYLNEHRIDLNILLVYDVDLINWKKELVKKVSNLKWVLDNSTPKIFVKELNEEGIKIIISVWAKDYFKIEEYRLILANEVKKLLIKKE